MRKFSMLTGLLLAVLSTSLHAAEEDTHTINMQVDEINELSLTEATVVLLIDTAVAGQNPNDATALTGYNITTNSPVGKKITAQITSGTVPASLDLKVTVEPPRDGTDTDVGASAGQVTLDGGAILDVVTGVTAVTYDSATGSAPDEDIEYVLTVTDPAAGPVALTSVDVTYTLVTE